MHATDQLPDQPHDSQAERVAWYALLALPAVVPTAILPTLMTATNPYGSSAFTAPKFLVLGLLVAVALGSWAVALVRGDVAVRDVPTKWWMLAFLALAGVSTATALNHVTAIFGHAENLVGLITFLMCASVWFLATQLVTGVHRMRLLARSVIIGGAIVALFGVLQALQVHPFGAALAQGWMPDRAASTVGNPDFTGTYLVFPVILSVAVGLSDKDARWRAAGWATFVACGLALFITMTRGAWVGAAIGLVLVGIAAGRSASKPYKPFLGALAGLLVALAASAAVPWIRSQFVRRIGELSAGFTKFTSGRTYIWHDALSIIARHPIFGVGPDSYRLGWFPVRSLADVAGAGAGSVTNDAHNVMLTLAATLGIPAALAVIGLLVATLLATFRPAFTRGSDASKLVYTGWWAALAGLSAALLFSVNTIVAMVMFSLGAAVLIAPRSPRTVPVRQAVSYTVAGLALVAVLAFAAIPSLTLLSDYTIARGATANPSLETVRAAVRQAPWNFAARNLDAYYTAAFAINAFQANDTQAAALFDEADQKTEALIAFNPHEYDSYYTRARLLTDAGRFLGGDVLLRAVTVADEGLIVQPNGLRLRVQKALALYDLGRDAEAAQTLAGHWDDDPNYLDAGTLYAETLILSGDKTKAEEVLAVLRERFPANPDVARIAAMLKSNTPPAQ